MSDDGAILRDFFPPSTTSEALAVLDSAWALKRKDIMADALQTDIVGNSSDPAVKYSREKYHRLLGTAS
jgi:hypothetical protein